MNYSYFQNELMFSPWNESILFLIHDIFVELYFILFCKAQVFLQQPTQISLDFISVSINEYRMVNLNNCITKCTELYGIKTCTRNRNDFWVIILSFIYGWRFISTEHAIIEYLQIMKVMISGQKYMLTFLLIRLLA